MHKCTLERAPFLGQTKWIAENHGGRSRRSPCGRGGLPREVPPPESPSVRPGLLPASCGRQPGWPGPMASSCQPPPPPSRGLLPRVRVSPLLLMGTQPFCVGPTPNPGALSPLDILNWIVSAKTLSPSKTPRPPRLGRGWIFWGPLRTHYGEEGAQAEG